MKVAIIGSRNAGKLTVFKISQHVPADCTQIISGGATGVDSLAEQYARENNIPFVEVTPDYKIFGRQAPLVRNSKIVELADKVLAFWDYQSKGTAHTISECVRLNVPFEIISLANE